MITKFEDLQVWQKSHQLVLEIYKITKKFPDSERFGLVSQMRRAAVSIPANIAEGFRK
jgi:four helix bundle protein